MKPEELGEKVEGPGGSQVYAYIQWANGLAAQVKDAEDTGGFALGEVFNALPRPVKDLIHCEAPIGIQRHHHHQQRRSGKCSQQPTSKLPAHLSASRCSASTSSNCSTANNEPICKHGWQRKSVCTTSADDTVQRPKSWWLRHWTRS